MSTPEGDGFTCTSKNLDATQAKAIHGWLAAADVVAWQAAKKPPTLHLIITGRNAPAALIAHADLVTEMKLIKHPYKDKGIVVQPGIGF